MIKLVSINEIDQVMKIINDAKSLLKRNSLQWQQGYPNLETMTNDINNHHLYGYYKENKLIGIIALIINQDENYLEIEDGSWQIIPSKNDLNIHRLAIDQDFHKQKIGEKLIQFAIDFSKENHIKSIKVDTHESNIPMQILLERNNFSKRGFIYIKRDKLDNKRLAYELVN